jgi:integrase/recombinase XerC
LRGTEWGTESKHHHERHIMPRHAEGPWFRASKDAWYVTVHGRKISLRVYGKENRPAAISAWHLMIKKPAKLSGNSTPLIRDLVKAFLADAATRLKHATLRIYKDYLARFVVAFGGWRLEELTPSEVTQWMLTKTGSSSTSHGIALRCVSACFGWAVKNDIIENNIVRKIKRPKSRTRTASAVISEQDHEKLLAAATPEFALVLRVLHGTGCRPGEACKITSETFDQDNGVVILNDHKTDANGRPRIVFISPELMKILKEQLKKFPTGPLLRTSKGNGWTGRSITQAMRDTREKIGLRAIAYGYRHGFATAALSSGIPDAHVASLLGHTSTAVLHANYSHLSSQSEVLRKALSLIKR